jgi:hypothetical protein
MSVARVEIRVMEAQQLRLRDAVDIEKLRLFGGVKWRRAGPYGYRVPEEDDLRDCSGQERRLVLAQEVERFYTGLRKNHEDRGDRVGAHRWYWSEMEIGRRDSSDKFMKWARRFCFLDVSVRLLRSTLCCIAWHRHGARYCSIHPCMGFSLGVMVSSD